MRLLFSGTVDMNTTNDQELTKIYEGPLRQCAIFKIAAIYVSGTFALAAGRCYHSEAKAGTLTGFTTFTGLSGALKYVDMALAPSQVVTTGRCFVSLNTANGVALSAAFFVYGSIIE